ncbi:MAG: SGNH/GDSL hydrolase family protein [Gammaproteobacteria bacterium]
MRTHLTLWLLISLISTTTGAWATFSSIYVFGDSLSDNGTAADFSNIDFPSPYSSIPAQDINRVSNGPLAVEVLASQLGLPLNPSLFATSIPAAGTNYAVAGASAGGIDLGDLGSQLTAFQANHPGGAPMDALYVLFIGGNDVRSISDVVDDAVAALSIAAATQAVETTLNSLIDAGAQSILVPNVFDIGLIPEAAANQALATQRSLEYNTALATTLAGVEGNQGINLFEYDLFGFSQRMVADPLSFGLTNVSDACTTGLLFPVFLGSCDASLINQYAFIDDIHPTANIHNILGNELLNAIPVPAALPLFVSGLLMLGAWSRRRH